MIVAFLVLLSRPWWMTARGEFDNLILRVAQQAQGLPVDGTRLYTEYTVDWQAMYFGWPTVILAVLGYVVLLYRLIRRSDYRLLGFLVMALSLSALYLWTPQITPDQVWAMRRYVPVVVPGLIIAAVAALRAAWTWWTTSSAVRVVVRGGVIVACVAVLVIPWLVTRPVRDLREEAPQAAQVHALCAAVPSDGAVLVVDESLRWGYLQTIRSYCEVPTLALVGASSASGGRRGARGERTRPHALRRRVQSLAADLRRPGATGVLHGSLHSVAEHAGDASDRADRADRSGLSRPRRGRRAGCSDRAMNRKLGRLAGDRHVPEARGREAEGPGRGRSRSCRAGRLPHKCLSEATDQIVAIAERTTLGCSDRRVVRESTEVRSGWYARSTAPRGWGRETVR